MSDSYKSQPWQVPQRTGSPPMKVQTNTHIPADANNLDKGVLIDAGNRIVNHHSAQLDRFVSNQRQQISIAGNDYHDRRWSGQGLDARYQYNSGHEKLTLDVYPVGGQKKSATTSETNLDGYVIWIHGQPNYPYDTDSHGVMEKLGPWTILMNGYVIEDSWQPRDYFDENNAMAYIALFGKTAMLCQSMMDKEQLNKFKNEGLKEPYILVPPSQGDTKPGSSPTGIPQPARPDIFGYWIFDWINDDNPCSYIKGFDPDTGQPTNYRWNDAGWAQEVNVYAEPQHPPHFGKTIPISGGIFFPDVRTGKSPLAPTGLNAFGTDKAAGSDPLGWFVPCVDLFISEWYDRGKYMVVSQSWSVPTRADQTISVNNKPILFGRVDNQAGYSTGNGSHLSFNLDPKFTKTTTEEGNQNNQYLLGPHDGLQAIQGDSQGDGPGDVLTDAQKAEVADWAQQNYDIMQPFLQQQAKDAADVLSQIMQMTDDARIAEDCAYWLRAQAKDPRAYTTGIYKQWANDRKAYIHDQNVLNSPNLNLDTATLVPPQQPGYSNGAIITMTLLEWGPSSLGNPILANEANGVPNVYWVAIPHRKDYQKIQSTNGIPNYDQTTSLFDENMFQLANHDQLISEAQLYQGPEHEDYYDNSGSGGIMHDLKTWEALSYSGFPFTTNYNLYDNTYYKVFGPSTGNNDAIIAQMTEFVTTTMTKLDTLTTQYNNIMARKPPDLIPYPFTRGSIAQFKYSKFGQSLNYNQDP